MTKHLRSPVPPLQAANRNVTDAFAQLARHMLAKKPEERPRSMADFLAEMHATEIFKVPPTALRQQEQA